jgi:3-oxoacyl-[acyl-carrier-protein] synthase II
MKVVISGFAAHVPGVPPAQLGGAADDVTRMCAPEDARELLGRKGLLYKEPATLLALCAVQRALGLPPGRPAGPVAAPGRTAVVVSSNLGNVHTVCDIVTRIRAASYREIGPLETPNASSNVIASAIAIRFGAKGPNLSVCNGATSGVDAVRVGARLIRAGRADKVLVVGAEPTDETASSLVKLRDVGAFAGIEAHPLRAAAAAVVLERDDLAETRHAVVGDATVLAPGPWPSVAAGPGLALPPYGERLAGTPELSVDLTERLGETYGALGVLQTAVAAAWLRGRGEDTTAVLAAGDRIDGYAALTLHGPRPAGARRSGTPIGGTSR